MVMLDDARRTLNEDRRKVSEHGRNSGSARDDMGDMILGDVHYHHEDKSKASERANSSLGTVAKAAIGLGLLASGAGAGVAIPLLLQSGKEVIERVETIDNTRQVAPGFGLPD